MDGESGEAGKGAVNQSNRNKKKELANRSRVRRADDEAPPAFLGRDTGTAQRRTMTTMVQAHGKDVHNAGEYDEVQRALDDVQRALDVAQGRLPEKIGVPWLDALIDKAIEDANDDGLFMLDLWSALGTTEHLSSLLPSLALYTHPLFEQRHAIRQKIWQEFVHYTRILFSKGFMLRRVLIGRLFVRFGATWYEDPVHLDTHGLDGIVLKGETIPVDGDLVLQQFAGDGNPTLVANDMLLWLAVFEFAFFVAANKVIPDSELAQAIHSVRTHLGTGTVGANTRLSVRDLTEQALRTCTSSMNSTLAWNVELTTAVCEALDPNRGGRERAARSC